MKTTGNTTIDAKLENLRLIKKEASRRCRARAKCIQNGDPLTVDLVIRSLTKNGLKLDNFKVELENKSVRLNKNGGNAVAMVIIEKSNDKIVKTRKSFKDLKTAAIAFKEIVNA